MSPLTCSVSDVDGSPMAWLCTFGCFGLGHAWRLFRRWISLREPAKKSNSSMKRVYGPNIRNETWGESPHARVCVWEEKIDPSPSLVGAYTEFRSDDHSK